MYCQSCGAQNLDNARFCASCGAAIGGDRQPGQPMQAYPQNQYNPQNQFAQQKTYPSNSPKLAYASLATALGATVVNFAGSGATGDAATFLGVLVLAAFIVALVLGVRSLKTSSAARGCAKAGMIISIVMLGLVVLLLLLGLSLIGNM